MTAIDSTIIEQVSAELQAYVYMLVDPRGNIPFYVGKGHGLRHAAHVAEALEPIAEGTEERTRKHNRINEILSEGYEPDVWILRYGLQQGEYTAVEAAAIDLLMSFRVTPSTSALPLARKEQLTNARREHARGHGVTLLQSLIDEFAAPTLTTTEPLLLITINGWTDLPDGEVIAGGRVRYGAGFKSEWLVSSMRQQAYDDIGESVSAWWRISPDHVAKSGIEHVAAVHRGVTRALFKVIPGSWEVSETKRTDNGGRPIRKAAFWFDTVSEGELFDQVVGPYGHRIPDKPAGSQNAINYWPRPPVK